MSVFRTPEGREAVRAQYRAILDQFPVARRYVDTPEGRTFVLEAGAKDAPPVVLLHGACGNSAFWLGDILPMAMRFRVLALDIPGEAGNSDENRLDLASDAHARWLKAALDALGASRAALIGNSFGGFAALKLAIAYPERVAKLVLIAAPGVVPPSPLFDPQALEAAVKGADGRSALGEAVSAGAALPPPVAEFLRLIAEHFAPMTEPLPLFSDAALGSLSMPVLFAAGARDATMDARAAAARLGRLLPRLEARLLEDAGHIVMNVAEIALPFLSEPPEPRTALRNGVAVAVLDRWARFPRTQDMLDAMATAHFSGCGGMVVFAESLGAAFFDLKTGVAGEMLQKFSNYRMRLAIVGDFSKYAGKSLKDFIRESNERGAVRFVGSEEEAVARLTLAR